MGIWGTLEGISLPDLLMLLEARSGTLYLRAPKRPVLTIPVGNGRIGTALEGKRPISYHRLEERLFALMKQPDTAFTFHSEEHSQPAQGPALADLAVKLSVLHKETEELAKALPKPDQVFVLHCTSACANRYWQTLFDRAKPYLAKGISALELSELLRVSLPMVRHFLYAALRAEKIKPQSSGSAISLIPQSILKRFAPTL